jgi:hypothetical protein
MRNALSNPPENPFRRARQRAQPLALACGERSHIFNKNNLDSAIWRDQDRSFANYQDRRVSLLARIANSGEVYVAASSVEPAKR